MKKVVLASLLAFAVAAPVSSICFAQAAGAAGTTGATGQVQMSQEEYAAYNNANTQTDPSAKATAFEAYLKQYPNSAVKVDVLNQLLYAYSQAGDKANALNAADRLLAVDPNNLRAITLEVYYRKADADAITDPTAKATAMDPVVKYAQQGLSATKPKDVTDADWQKLQAAATPTFQSALGDAALAKKDYPGAITAYKAELAAVPAEQTQTPGPVLQDVVFLANAYMSQGDFLSCAWYATRAAVYAGQYAPKIQPLATYCYKKYHGDASGYDALQAQVKTSLNPPANLSSTVKAAPKPEDIVAQTIASTPDLATLALPDKEFIIQYGAAKDPKTQTKDASGAIDPNSGKTYADEVFDSVKGKSVELPNSTVIAATDSQLQLAVSDDAVQSKTADFTVNLKTPLTKVPTPGEKVTVQGTYDSYTQKPVMITMSNGEVVTKKAAPAKKSAAPAHRPAARRR